MEQTSNRGGIAVICQNPPVCRFRDILSAGFRTVFLKRRAAEPVPDPGINYIGLREILLELITNLNVILNLSTCHTLHIIVLTLFMIMP